MGAVYSVSKETAKTHWNYAARASSTYAMLSFAFTFFVQIVGRNLPETYSSSPLRIDSFHPHHRHTNQMQSWISSRFIATIPFLVCEVAVLTFSVSMVEMSASESRVYANFDPVSTVSILFIHYTLVHVNLIVANIRRFRHRYRYM